MSGNTHGLGNIGFKVITLLSRVFLALLPEKQPIRTQDTINKVSCFLYVCYTISGHRNDKQMQNVLHLCTAPFTNTRTCITLILVMYSIYYPVHTLISIYQRGVVVQKNVDIKVSARRISGITFIMKNWKA